MKVLIYFVSAVFVLLMPLLSFSGEVIYYEKSSVHNIKFIIAYLNGVPVEMVFDTGASYIAVTKEIYEKLGVDRIIQKGKASTASGVVDTYIFILRSVKVGNVELYNVPASYSPAYTQNLLGNSFIGNFNYFVEEHTKIIKFLQKGSNLPVPESTLEIKIRDIKDKK